MTRTGTLAAGPEVGATPRRARAAAGKAGHGVSADSAAYDRGSTTASPVGGPTDPLLASTTDSDPWLCAVYTEAACLTPATFESARRSADVTEAVPGTKTTASAPTCAQEAARWPADTESDGVVDQRCEFGFCLLLRSTDAPDPVQHLRWRHPGNPLCHAWAFGWHLMLPIRLPLLGSRA